MSKTPRTDDFVECYATGMNREVAPHHKFMRVADFARQLETENAELRASLKECVEYAERYEDSGPFGEGWQSERLVKACQRARALLAKVEGK